MEGSLTPATAQCCRFATRTTSLWSSSLPWARRASGESVLRRWTFSSSPGSGPYGPRVHAVFSRVAPTSRRFLTGRVNKESCWLMLAATASIGVWRREPHSRSMQNWPGVPVSSGSTSQRQPAKVSLTRCVPRWLGRIERHIGGIPRTPTHSGLTLKPGVRSETRRALVGPRRSQEATRPGIDSVGGHRGTRAGHGRRNHNVRSRLGRRG